MKITQMRGDFIEIIPVGEVLMEIIQVRELFMEIIPVRKDLCR